MKSQEHRKLIRAFVWPTLLVAWIVSVGAWAETIELKDGRKIEGKIVALKERSVTIESSGSYFTLARDRVVEPDPVALMSRAKGQLAGGNAQNAADFCRQILFWHAGNTEAQDLLKQAEAAILNPTPVPSSSTTVNSSQPPAANASPARGARTLHFPAGWAVGTVFFRALGTANSLNLHQRDWTSGRNDPTWIGGGQAQGEVQVPPGREVLVRIAKGAANLEFLDPLGEDDLYALQIEPGCTPGDQDMARIGRLTGLVELYVRANNSSITGAGSGELARLARLRILDFSGATGAAGNNLVFLSSLAGLRELDLYDIPIRPTDLDFISDLASLQVLGLGSPTNSGLLQFADQDLKRLAPLTSLKSLRLLTAQGIAGSGLTYLTGASHLESLDLSGSALADVHLSVLKEFPSLKFLNLTDTAITGKGIARLADVPLFELALGGEANNILGDADMKVLASVKALRKLTLRNMNMVTDTGLESLKTMTSLQLVRLIRTGFSKSGIDALRKAMPNCTITVSGKA